MREEAFDHPDGTGHRDAFGQLAGGIAHDFNNALLSLRGYGELALRRLERGDPGVEEDIAEMLDASDRAAALTHQLLALGRRRLDDAEVRDALDPGPHA